MRNWEPQVLPGLLQDDPHVQVPVPWPTETVDQAIDAILQLRNVSIPDWLDTVDSPYELDLAEAIFRNLVCKVNDIREQIVLSREIT